MECDWCDEVFDDENKWTFHTQSVHLGVTHKCYICSKEFLRLEDVEIHIGREHFGMRGNRCHICSKTFATLNGLKEHIQNIHLGIRHKCPYCDRDFSLDTNLRVHVKGAHPSECCLCDVCGWSFTSKTRLQRHLQSFHIHGDGCQSQEVNEKRRYDPCGKVFVSSQTLRIHNDSVHLGIRHECHLCDSNYSNRGNLLTHIRTSHLVSSTKSAASKLLRSARMNVIKKEFGNMIQNKSVCVCKTCGADFLSKEHLSRHRRKYHSSGGQNKPRKLFSCGDCRRKFVAKFGLKIHMIR